MVGIHEMHSELEKITLEYMACKQLSRHCKSNEITRIMVLFFLDLNRVLSYSYHAYYSIIHLSYMGI